MLKAKKSLSQNFLTDKNISKKIINLTNIEDRVVLEIGPGLGFMTESILFKKPKKLILIEKDKNLTDLLKNKYKNNNNVLIECEDILNYDLSKYKNLIIIANLPYNVSSKIILHLFHFNKNICEMILMIQKEMAQKFNYNLPKMNKYKFLTKILSTYSVNFDVSSKVFIPKPKVKSSVVKFKFNKEKFDLDNAILFSNLIFKNIRKKINNNINIKNSSQLLEKRVNQLKIEELFNIYNFF